jgi:hypothetical protein
MVAGVGLPIKKQWAGLANQAVSVCPDNISPVLVEGRQWTDGEEEQT